MQSGLISFKMLEVIPGFVCLLRKAATKLKQSNTSLVFSAKVQVDLI